jgi:hypothetical protein
MADVQNLGNGYYCDYSFSQETSVLYTAESSYNGIGSQVVPPKVDSISFNNDYIFACRTHNQKEYYIIDKSDNFESFSSGNKVDGGFRLSKNVLGPLTRNEFDRILKSRAIELNFHATY